jgi:hypothetical protein
MRRRDLRKDILKRIRLRVNLFQFWACNLLPSSAKLLAKVKILLWSHEITKAHNVNDERVRYKEGQISA